MATGIKDKVAIIGMGCTRFGERWDVGAEELMVEAFTEALDDAKIDRNEIEAAWTGNWVEEIQMGKSATVLSTTLRLPKIPVTRIENWCATGTELLRAAVYAVASGAYDIVMALGYEKLKDAGYGGLPNFGSDLGSLNWLYWHNLTAPGMFAQLANAYSAKYKIPPKELKRALATVSAKSHANGVKNPKAHLRKAVSVEQIMAAPMVAYPLGLFDCCGVSDGAACAIVTSVEKAKDMGYKDFVTVKGINLAVSSGEEIAYNSWDGADFLTTPVCAKKVYDEAGITKPREQIDMMELHDCFSVCELVTYEALGISEQGGGAVKDTLDGFFFADGKIPSQIDGGLKCFGHPIGASGLRMVYEMYLQLHGRAGERQLKDPKIGLTHNLGGFPIQNLCSICVVGKYGV
jgi:acetyl-CoA C-acetyltransferase